ncbi:MAG: TIGR02302 family protein [Rhodobacteraceae bacterium]|nr:TIGR02302 family protein [Paracoccaceae bacterium]
MANITRPNQVMRSLRLPLLLTRAGQLAEQVLRAFWPLISICLVVLAALMLGLHEISGIEIVWGTGVISLLAALMALIWGGRRFRWPTRAKALARLDETLPGRPIAALLDDQAIGANDPQSLAVWRAHQRRMAIRAGHARAPAPDIRLARRDPFALRYVALLVFAVALLFGSFWRIGTVTALGPAVADTVLTSSWEGWIEPPRYTGQPTLYLNDQTGKDLRIAEGSTITVRLYGEVGTLTLAETISGGTGAGSTEELSSAADPAQEFIAKQSGDLRIDGTGGQSWQVTVVEDTAPQISVAGPAKAAATGEMTLAFTASDDYGVVAGQAVIALDRDALERRYGLALDPEPRERVNVELPMPISGDRSMFTETLIEDFSSHPWANLPVTISLTAEDAAGHVTHAPPFATILPARRFFDPMAAAIIEMRRDLLWTRGNGPRVAQILRAISHRPEDVFRKETAYLRLRVLLRRLETFTRFELKPNQQEEIAEALWDLAILLEEGDIGDALERLRRAQERLSEAMKNGASDEEIAELMQELRDASREYMRQMARLAQENGEVREQGEIPENMLQMDQADLQKMMDRIQELMEQGRMAEAEQALQELQELMENMAVTNAPGQDGQSEGQQAMEGLADTLREQQGLSDQAFRDLQEQFNPNAQAGESQENEGRSGGQGRGESHEGQGGAGTGEGEGDQGQSEGQDSQPGSLADRQQALRDELTRQQGQLPGGGTPEGEAARDAIERAGRAMNGAEDALREDDLAGAIDKQSEAMEALREGMRSLGEALAQQEQQNQPGQGTAESDMRSQNRDPLGRNPGARGSAGTDENLLQGEDVYRRARELLDEIRRRSGDGNRPDIELDYLRRLLDRF